MSGICGFMTKKNIKIDTLENMNKNLNHKGMSQQELYFEDNDLTIGLAEKISFGVSPEYNEKCIMNIVVSFDGVIYNYNEIRSKLREYALEANNSTELIVYSYKLWGINFLNRLNGVFLISLYDKEQKKLFIARDRAGSKPLYYYLHDDDFVYSSELKTLISFPYFNKLINTQSIYKYFIYQYVPTPQTMFKNTYKLYPGSYLEYSKGNIKIEKYWDILRISTSGGNLSELEVLNNLERLLYDSIKLRINSDEAQGILLTGSPGSSLITSMIANMSGSDVKTYSVRFNHKDSVESQKIKRLAAYLDTMHTEINLDSNDIIKTVYNISECYDEPLADSSILSDLLTAKYMKKDTDIRICSDGENELFGGYQRYTDSNTEKWLYLFNSRLKAYINKTMYKIPKDGEKIKSTKREILSEYYRNYISLYDKTLCDDLVLSVDNVFKTELFDNTFEQSYKKTDNYLSSIMMTDVLSYLPDNILIKLNRSSINYDLGLNNPFLDHRVIEYSQNIPVALKYKNNEKMYIIKRLLEKNLPKEIIPKAYNSPEIPMGEYFKSDLKDLLLTYLESHEIKKYRLLNPDAIENLVNSHMEGRTDNSKILWALLAFQMWCDKNIK